MQQICSADMQENVHGWIAEDMVMGHSPGTAGQPPAWGPAGAWPPADDKTDYLYVYTTASQGFGDKVRWFYDVLALAKFTQRTLILPPIGFTERNDSSIAGLDPYALKREDPNGWAAALQNTARQIIETKPRVLPFTAWFDGAAAPFRPARHHVVHLAAPRRATHLRITSRADTAVPFLRAKAPRSFACQRCSAFSALRMSFGVRRLHTTMRKHSLAIIALIALGAPTAQADHCSHVLTPKHATSADARADLMKQPHDLEMQLQTDARADVALRCNDKDKLDAVVHGTDKDEIDKLTPKPATSADARADLMQGSEMAHDHPQDSDMAFDYKKTNLGTIYMCTAMQMIADATDWHDP
eukprot:g2937.t1